MISPKNVALTLLTALAPQAAFCGQPITQIVVWDSNFKLVTTISEKDSTKGLNELWKAKKVAKPASSPNWKYEIDVYASKEASRWLYDPKGFAMKSTKSKSPIYSIPSPERFNRLLEVTP